MASTSRSNGNKTTDFIIVYKKNWLAGDPARLRKFQQYTDNLIKLGLTLETVPFLESNSNLIFVKLHASDSTVIMYSALCDVNLACRTLAYRPNTKPPPHFMATPISHPDPTSLVYQRAPESISSAIPKNITSAERILVIYKLLVRVKYGPNEHEYGINKMKKEKLIFDYFAMHEGPYQWTESGPLMDRQILAKYWGSFGQWYKAQPTHLVERYYGTEVGFYYAWLEHYIKMLTIPAILSVIVLLYGLSTLHTDSNRRSQEICESNLLMCPRCHYLKCKMERLSSFCLMSHLAYLFDNLASIANAIFVSVWSTVFMEVWRRHEAILQIQWNIQDLEYDIITRPEYLEKAKKTHYSMVTGEEEPYVPLPADFVWHTVTFVVVAMMLSLVIQAVIGVMIYSFTVRRLLVSGAKDDLVVDNRNMISAFTSGVLSGGFILLFRQIFRIVALWLTTLEVHRTQCDFDNAYIYKNFGFEFINNYASLIYIAFFKGRFFTHPGDLEVSDSFGGLGSDICNDSGCIFELGLQMMLIFTIKSIGSQVIQNFYPYMENKARYYWAIRSFRKKDLSFNDDQFLSRRTDYFFLVDDYVEMVIQYGFVVFFVAAFPLAPFFAFISNIFEIRTDATKMTKFYRRPVPRNVSGLGAWYGILQGMTYLGVVFNAFIIAFTSNAIDTVIYQLNEVEEVGEGFFNTTLSAYDLREFFYKDKRILGQKWCYYPGRRYPPDHPQRYQLTKDYWYILGLRFLVVVIFEHILMGIKGILAYAIPGMPKYVTKQLVEEEKKARNQRMGSK